MHPALVRARAALTEDNGTVSGLVRRDSPVSLSLNAWQIFGIAVAVVLILGFAGGCYYIERRKRKNAAAAGTDPEDGAQRNANDAKGVATETTTDNGGVAFPTYEQELEMAERSKERTRDWAEAQKDAEHDVKVPGSFFVNKAGAGAAGNGAPETASAEAPTQNA